MKTKDEVIDRLLELLVYTLIKKTKVYNHELATQTLNGMKNIVYDNLQKSTDELTKQLVDYWDNLGKTKGHTLFEEK